MQAMTKRRRLMVFPLAMGEHFLARYGHLGSQDFAVKRIGDEQGAALRAAVGDVGHEPVVLAGVNEVRRQAVRVETPDAHAEMAYGEAVLGVHLDAVRAGVAARQLDRNARLRGRAARHQRQAPDLLRARDGDIDLGVLRVQRDAVRRGRVDDQALQLAACPQTVYAPARIGDARLSLVGEVEVTVVGEVQVVETLEPFAEGGLEQRLDLSGLRIEQHQATPVVGDEDAAVLVDLQAVRPAVVLDDEFPSALRVDAEDSPERNVHAPEVSLAVERRPLEEAVHRCALAVGVRPRRTALPAEFRRKRGEGMNIYALNGLKGILHGFFPARLQSGMNYSKMTSTPVR